MSFIERHSDSRIAPSNDRRPHTARTALTVAGLILAAGCGGSGGSSSPAPAEPTPAPTAPATGSAGGIWFVPGTLETAVTLFVSEDGLLHIFDQGWLGTGAVIVMSRTEVAGSYERIKPQGVTTDPREFRQSCEASGTVQPHASLSLTVLCEDWQGNAEQRTLDFLYDASYERDSSLDAIAGNYEVPGVMLTNTLSISNNGVIFGTFHNGGANCTGNGSVEIIDPSFTIYGIDLTLSLCTGIAATFHEGETISGLVVAEPAGAAPGAFLMLTSLVVNDGLIVFSLLYEPV